MMFGVTVARTAAEVGRPPKHSTKGEPDDVAAPACGCADAENSPAKIDTLTGGGFEDDRRPARKGAHDGTAR